MVHVQIANNHYKEINGNSGNEACVQPPSFLPFSRFFLRGGSGCTQTMATLIIIMDILSKRRQNKRGPLFLECNCCREKFQLFKI